MKVNESSAIVIVLASDKPWLVVNDNSRIPVDGIYPASLTVRVPPILLVTELIPALTNLCSSPRGRWPIPTLSNRPVPVSVVGPSPNLDTPMTPRSLYAGSGITKLGLI